MPSSDIAKQILDLIESSIEDTRVPDAIAAHADKRVGKPVTKTDAEQLEAQLGIPVRITRRYGMTHVAWAVGKGPNPWSEERSILLAHSDTNVRWPTGEELRKKEPAYFGARDERNEARRKLLAEHREQEIQRTLRHANERVRQSLPPHARSPMPDSESGSSSLVSRAAAAVIKLREAREELAKLLDYGQPLHVVRFPIEKLVEKE